MNGVDALLPIWIFWLSWEFVFRVGRATNKYCLSSWSGVFYVRVSFTPSRIWACWKSNWYAYTEFEVYISHEIIRCLAYFPNANCSCSLLPRTAKKTSVCVNTWTAWRRGILSFASAVVQSPSLAWIFRQLVLIFRLLAASLVCLILVPSFMIFSGLNLFFLMPWMY